MQGTRGPGDQGMSKPGDQGTRRSGVQGTALALMAGGAGEDGNNFWDLQTKTRRSEKHQDKPGERDGKIKKWRRAKL